MAKVSTRRASNRRLWPVFQWVPTPRSWLSAWLNRNGCSQTSSLASRLSLYPSQLCRMLSGREAVPSAHFHELAMILNPRDIHHLPLIDQCEVLTHTLQGLLLDLTGGEERSLHDASSSVSAELRRLVKHETPGSIAYTRALNAYLGSAAYILRQFRASQQDLTAVPLSVLQIERHLQYPSNHFFGAILNVGHRHPTSPIGELRFDTLQLLRQRAHKWARPGNQSDAFVSQHSIHILARFGDPGDEQFVDDLAQTPRAGLDPTTKRLAVIGLALRNSRSRDLNLLLHAMQTDDALREASLQFDALHYGSTSINQFGRPLRITAIRSILPHILRHLLDSNEYAQIIPLEQRTFCDLVDRFGADVVTSCEARRLVVLWHARRSGPEPIHSRFLQTVQRLANIHDDNALRAHKNRDRSYLFSKKTKANHESLRQSMET